MRCYGVLTCFVWSVLCSSVSAGDPPVEDIVAKVLKRDEELAKTQAQLAFNLDLVHQKLDRTNQILGTREAKVRITPGGNTAYQQVVGAANTDESGKPLEAKDQKNVKDARNAMKQMNLRRLASRFDIALDGSESRDGVDCWVLKFSPKKGQPYESREEKIINQLGGRFWVAKSDYSIVGSEGKLTQPVSIAWVMATMNELEFEYRTQPFGQGERLPAKFDMLIDVQVPLTYIRRRQISVMDGYEKQRSHESTALEKKLR